jgi:hypothetical protein
MLLAISSLGLAYAFMAGKYQEFPYLYVSRIEEPITQYLKGLRDDLPVSLAQAVRQLLGRQEIQTILLRLKKYEVEVPLPLPGNGGGLTTVGNELLLLSGRGQIYRVDKQSAKLLGIQAAYNGWREFMTLDQSESHKQFEFLSWPSTRPRYHDIQFYEHLGQAGLLVSYTEWLPEGDCYGTSIARLPLPAGIPLEQVTAVATDWQTVYRTQPCLPLKTTALPLAAIMGGSRIAYRGDGKILLGVGDYAWNGVLAEEALARQLDNDYGKVLEIDINSGAATMLSYGHRNLQGITVDDVGNIWTLEHGVRGGDELNLIQPGGDYGWPGETLGTAYDGAPWPGAAGYGRLTSGISPVFAWLPSIGISNLVQLNGFHPAWDGDLLVASMAKEKLIRVRMHEQRVMYTEELKFPRRIRYVEQLADGGLALWTDHEKMIFLEPMPNSQ